MYGNGEAVNGEKDLGERANAFTAELAQFINNAQDIKKKIKQDHTEEGARTMAAPAIQQVQERLKKELEQFDKNNDLGTYQK